MPQKLKRKIGKLIPSGEWGPEPKRMKIHEAPESFMLSFHETPHFPLRFQTFACHHNEAVFWKFWMQLWHRVLCGQSDTRLVLNGQGLSLRKAVFDLGPCAHIVCEKGGCLQMQYENIKYEQVKIHCALEILSRFVFTRDDQVYLDTQLTFLRPRGFVSLDPLHTKLQLTSKSQHVLFRIPFPFVLHCDDELIHLKFRFSMRLTSDAGG